MVFNSAMFKQFCWVAFFLCLVLFFLVIFPGCGKKEYKEAVVEKKFVPQHIYLKTIPMGYAIVSTPVTVPDSWFLYTENHRASVSEKLYDIAEIGDTLAVTKEEIQIKKYD